MKFLSEYQLNKNENSVSKQDFYIIKVMKLWSKKDKSTINLQNTVIHPCT